MSVVRFQLVSSLICPSTHRAIVLAFALVLGAGSLASAQTAPAQPAADERTSIAVETDILSFFIGGYSAMVNVSFPNKFQMAFGIGSYDVPGFLVEGDPNFDVAQWEARVTSVQVFRATYRFRGPMRSGPALGGVILNQNWRLQSAPLNGETTFREVSAGVTGGYYIHVGKHFYIYPTAAYTFNNVYSGETSVNGTNYKTDKFSPNASLHVGWAW
jgi:hypothetical protein